jgi:hypothetical protein
MAKSSMLAAAAAVVGFACGGSQPPEADQVGVQRDAINGPWYTPSFTEVDQAGAGLHTGNLSEYCTATVIAPNYFLSAKHCGYVVGSEIFRYPNGNPAAVNTGFAYVIDQVVHAPCTGNDPNYWTDCNGDFADMVVLHVQQTIADNFLWFSYTPAATLAWTYPGAGGWGTKVGAGAHDGNPNPSATLRAVDDTLGSTDDSGGGFHTDHVEVDKGDSGGPFYYNGRMLGTVTGYGFPLLWEATYTSVPHRLDWILQVIGYSLPLSGWAWDRGLSGSQIELFYGTELTCQYACQHTSGCGGYNFYRFAGLCQTLSSVGASIPETGVTCGQL